MDLLHNLCHRTHLNADAAAAAPAAAGTNGDTGLKQTGVKLSLKKSEGDSAAKTVTTPAPTASGTGSGDAAATVAMPAPAAAGATAPAEPPTEGGTKGKIVMTKAPKSSAESDVMPALVQEEEADEPGKLSGICAIISFLALGAACYFIVMDFLKFVK